MFNQRGYKILLQLLENAQIFSIEQLADSFSVSERTVRYDLDEIDYFLKYSNFPLLNRKQNIGVSYQIELTSRENLLIALSEYLKTFAVLSTEGRLLELVLKLATAKEPLKLETEKDLIGVSKSTLFKDFEKVREVFSSKDIILEGSRRGYLLLGNDIHICFKTAKVVLNFLSSEEMIDIMQFLFFENKKINPSIEKILDSNNKTLIMAEIEKFHNSINLSDENYLFALFALAIAMERGIEWREGTGFHRSLENILKSIEFNENSQSTAEFAEGMVEFVEDKTRISFQNDPILQSGIKLELRCILSKLGHMNLETEEMNKLISANQQLAFAIESFGNGLCENLGIDRKFSKEDVYKLLIHFVEALDRKLYFGISKPKVAVLSPFSRNISKMIEERILSYFDIEIIAVGDLREISETVKRADIDFVISTLQIYFENIITIVVNPLISNIDIANLKRILPTRVVDVMTLKKIYEFSKEFVREDSLPGYISGIQEILNIKTRENIEGED